MLLILVAASEGLVGDANTMSVCGLFFASSNVQKYPSLRTAGYENGSGIIQHHVKDVIGLRENSGREKDLCNMVDAAPHYAPRYILPLSILCLIGVKFLFTRDSGFAIMVTLSP